MSALYWIKLYIEILDDPKMATLPDRLWRRFIECCLLAGRIGKSGFLPDTNQIAWVLRVDTDSLSLDLQQLSQIGLVERNVNSWLVTKFAERQAAVPVTERMKQYRERLQKQQYYAEETNSLRDVTQINRLTESDTEAEVEVENDAPPANPLLAAFVKFAKVPDFGTGRVADALQEMNKAEVIPEDIQAAVAWMDEKGYSIRSISSIVNPAVTEAGKRKRGGNGKKATGPTSTLDRSLAAIEEAKRRMSDGE